MTHIKITIGRDGLWGDTDPDLYDQDTSEGNYEETLSTALTSQYPDAHIEVHTVDCAPSDGVETDMEEERPNIDQLIHYIWVDFGWVAEKAQ